ncbi:Protein N-acetyltransferase, RimJ/RimL family [Actinopolyspora xinjiangensis]|uniref:Protein N-acetyltransferase, RimJ/RimL family n=1 Tax=Actinopolyspora xinjiangensis TaxID=405564 RepID=A0A1H0VL94_9ACTN|nr:GNAT family protein [Actinopolyspora xinjiangensis]SDP79094.1 Protein N-acetyltransferase, RimJ/RimL family [Actinopolyspora xinjiangensis]
MFAHPLGSDAELRPLEPWQAAEFAEFTEANREHLAPWLPWADLVVDEESARRFLGNYANKQAEDTGRIMGIHSRGELVGGALFRGFDTSNGCCEIGVWLSESAQGNGLVTRTCEHLIDWAVRIRGMARVEYRVSTENHRSIAVAKRLGMTHEGTLRGYFPVRGRRHDMQIWALLAEEWHGGTS